MCGRSRPVRPPRGRRMRRVRAAAAVLALFFILYWADCQLRPAVTTMAEYQCRVQALLAMNEAIEEELAQRQDLERQLVRAQRDESGAVSAIEMDAAALNELKARLTSAVSQKLLAVGDQEVRVPLGTLLGWQLFAGRGPDICMQIVPTSFVYSTIEDSFVSAGINQTQHRVLIVFQAEMSAILPGYSVTVEVENEVCVAQTLIVGEVPQVYAARS